jgi:anion-transporting  ArsA/GET3 family ATPase
MLDALLCHELVVVTGKGGTGKTTVAAALGLAAARRGRRVVVAEVAARDDVSRALAGTSAGTFAERAVADGLWHVSIDPQHAMEEYLRDQLPGPLASTLARSRAFGVLALATPGMRELLTVGKVWELAQADRRTKGGKPYDLVVLDAPATGHGVAELTAPRTFSDLARVGPIARQGRTIHAMLTDRQRTAVLAVATPEEMPVNETVALRDALAGELGQDLAAVVVNRVLPARLTEAEAARVGAAPVDHTVRRAASAGAGRAAAQRAQLARLRDALPGVEVATLPFLPVPELGTAELGRLADTLEAA